MTNGLNARRPILLVEDNPDDIELTRRAFRKNSLANDVVVCEDGTTSCEERDVVDRLGANSYARKPVAFAEFIEAVGQQQMDWLVLNEAPPV